MKQTALELLREAQADGTFVRLVQGWDAVLGISDLLSTGLGGATLEEIAEAVEARS